MRVVFIGCVRFSEETLRKLIALEVQIEGIVTKKSSTFNSDFVDLSKIAISENIPFIYTQNINSSETQNWIAEKKPDIICCFGWSQILKAELLNIPPKGVIGYHPSMLPQNRGRHPLIWAMALGLKETGSTFFKMDEGTDTGDILSQKVFPIFYEDYAIDVYERMTSTALLQLEELIPALIEEKVIERPQNDKNANSWRKRDKEDGKIDFRMSSNSIYNLVRALSKPYIGAHFVHQNHEYKVWSALEENCSFRNTEPGKILDIKSKKILVKTGENAIWLVDHEMENFPEIGEYLI